MSFIGMVRLTYQINPCSSNFPRSGVLFYVYLLCRFIWWPEHKNGSHPSCNCRLGHHKFGHYPRFARNISSFLDDLRFWLLLQADFENLLVPMQSSLYSILTCRIILNIRTAGRAGAGNLATEDIFRVVGLHTIDNRDSSLPTRSELTLSPVRDDREDVEMPQSPRRSNVYDVSRIPDRV